MEGFNGAEFIQILNLGGSDLQPVVLLAVGSESTEEHAGELSPRFRFPESDLIRDV